MNQSKASQITYFLLRVMTGLMFIQPGCVILLGWFGGMPGTKSPPPFLSQTWIGGVLELFGGIAIVLGLFTRPVAFVLSGEMAVAYWQFHAPSSPFPVVNQGIPAILHCFIFLYFAAQGGGIWSLDSLIWGKNKAVAEV